MALAQLRDADAEALGATRLVLDGLRDAREELVAHRARLRPRRRVVASRRFGIGVDAGDDDQALRAPVPWQARQRIDDRVDRVAATPRDRLLSAARPAERGDARSRDTDDRIEPIDRSRQAIDVILRPSGDARWRPDVLRLGRRVPR